MYKRQPYNWEPELDVPDADLETLWGEFYANLDAARDEAVPLSLIHI